MSGTLVLATHLRALDDAALRRLIHDREVRAGQIKDFFDLAEALLDGESVQQRLTRLDRGTLGVIAALAELAHRSGGEAVSQQAIADLLSEFAGRPDREDLRSRITAAADTALVTVDDEHRITVFRSVAEQLSSWPAFGLPGLAELAADPPPPGLEPVAETEARFVDRMASERAFSSVTEVTELLVELEREPARELARGGVALPDTKRLANAMSVGLESVARALRIADRAALVARESGSWMITGAGVSWLSKSSIGRWEDLARGWHERLPDDVQRMLAARAHSLWGEGLRGFIRWLYPAGGEWMTERILAFTGDAEALGITANQTPSAPGALLLTAGADAAAADLAQRFPAEVDRVYLQHDLSIVAPGPLTAVIDTRLRSMADVESRALASSYRVSAATVNRAMAAGETAESLLEFLESISLTGIPQPLDYLISEASARYGLLRAGSLPPDSAEPDSAEWSARSYLRSDDVTLLEAIAVDQNLSALGLTRTGEHRLVSRFPLETVFWVLSDARYPVAAESDEGRIVSLRRRRHARAASATGTDPVDDLIERLRLGAEAEPDEGEEAWMARQLDLAIRAKAAITVRVRLPDDSVAEYQLEPTSVAGGRLRARDRRADIERTLPLTRIVGIAHAADRG